MSPVTHFLAGWVVAGATSLRRREKAAVVLAGVAPDLDGLGIIPELLTRGSTHPLLWFSEYHHTLHTLAFALVVTLAAYLISANANSTLGAKIQGHFMPSRAAITAFLAFLSFHLHLLCDLVGSRGPDGDSWPIPYLKPFSDALQLSWQGQWPLNGWQNFAITGALLVATLWIAWKHGSSPVEFVSSKGNDALVTSLRTRFAPRRA
ncbi:MAG TPA: metal-dependent hydrolase [Candidatus Angelobacter sp.]|nr:metal-dependent hydrolase [Candidatus Angelobacter sp.]